MRDHPRWRGEHEHLHHPHRGHPGSPPLARGARRSPCTGTPTTWDHPRWRGEHASAWPEGVGAGGSPPLARGARSRDLPDTGTAGITPAGAGSTPGHSACFSALRDHPRWRGEHIRNDRVELDPEGSPPLARGAPHPLTGGLLMGGITPAGAGSTTACRRLSLTGGDHPRWRGEHSQTPSPADTSTGSPPLARGARCRRVAALAARGITPAGAGSTLLRDAALEAGADHPRWRGEHPRVMSMSAPNPGSPPLARGAHDRVFPRAVAGGITPAGAGSTSLPLNA